MLCCYFTAVERENDELLALLDIQERAKYEKSKSVSSEDEYCTFNSTEVCILHKLVSQAGS